jgi:hypothetical protein
LRGKAIFHAQKAYIAARFKISTTRICRRDVKDPGRPELLAQIRVRQLPPSVVFSKFDFSIYLAALIKAHQLTII